MVDPQEPDTTTLPPRSLSGDATVPPSADELGTQPGRTMPGSAPLPAIPGYEILGELGRGGMGVVYKARHLKLNRIVALKMILAGGHADHDGRVRFLAEAEAVAALQHPNIVQIFEIGQHDGLPYFTLEFVGGGSLAQKINRRAMNAQAAAEIIEQLARGVAYAHGKGLIHRDLKPGNVLLAEDGTPKITDFGLAKYVTGTGDGAGGLTRSGAIMGTPSYMSPEQAQAKKEVGPSADVYSLGAILYECLTGQPPFEGNSTVDVVLQVIGAEPTPPHRLKSDIPKDLELICQRCLEKAPEQRPASAAELAGHLTQFLMGEHVAAVHLPLRLRLVRWCRARPALTAHLGVLLTCALVVTAKVIVTGNDHLSPIFPWVRLHFVLAFLGVWMLLSAAFQRGLRRQWTANLVPFVWSAVDVLILSATLLLTDTFNSPLAIGYPLLISASGLWLRGRVVWTTAGLTFLGYLGALLVLIVAGHADNYHRHAIFLASLIGVGYTAAYQVRRIQNLSRYYEGRSLH
jgi:serine/threonine-protein kinase